jgi:hypothetical protein
MTEPRRFPPLWSFKPTVGDHFKVHGKADLHESPFQ